MTVPRLKAREHDLLHIKVRPTASLFNHSQVFHRIHNLTTLVCKHSTMLFTTNIFCLLLATLSVAAPTAYSDDVQETGLVVRDDFTLSPWMYLSDVSTPGRRTALDTNKADIAVAAIQEIGTISSAVCTAAGSVACAGIGLASVFAVGVVAFFGIFSKCDLDSHGNLTIDFFSGYEPTEEYRGLSNVRAAVPKDGTPVHIGYVTVNGTRHESYFAHGGHLGHITHVRSVQLQPASL